MSDPIQIPFVVTGAETAEKQILDLADSLESFKTRLQSASQVTKLAGDTAVTHLGASFEKVKEQVNIASQTVDTLVQSLSSLKGTVAGNSGMAATFLGTFKQDAKDAQTTIREFTAGLDSSLKSLTDYRSAMRAAGVTADEWQAAINSTEKAQKRLEKTERDLAKAQQAVATAGSAALPEQTARVAKLNQKVIEQGEAYYKAQSRVTTLQAAIEQSKKIIPRNFSVMADSLLPLSTRIKQAENELKELDQAANRVAASMRNMQRGTDAYTKANIARTEFQSAALQQQQKLDNLREQSLAQLPDGMPLPLRRPSPYEGMSPNYSKVKLTEEQKYIENMRKQSLAQLPDGMPLPLRRPSPYEGMSPNYSKVKLTEEQKYIENMRKQYLAQLPDGMPLPLRRPSPYEGISPNLGRVKAARGLTDASGDMSNSQFLTNIRRLGMISPQAAQASMALDAVAGTFTKMSLASVAAIAGGVAVGIGIVKVGKSAIEASAELQKYNVTLQALAMHGWDTDDVSNAGRKALGQSVAAGAINYGASSTYTLSKVAESTEKLVGYGVDMRIVNDEMRMLGDLAMGDSNRLDHLAIAYGQVLGQGKARAQEMYQFINAGIPVFEEVAKHLREVTGNAKITTATVMDMTRNGEVSFKIIRDVLKELTAEGGRYHDFMKKTSQLSISNQWTIWQNQMQLLLGGIGNTMLPALTNLLIEVNKNLDRYNQGQKKEALQDIYKNRSKYSQSGLDEEMLKRDPEELRSIVSSYDNSRSTIRQLGLGGATTDTMSASFAGKIDNLLFATSPSTRGFKDLMDRNIKEVISEMSAAGATSKEINSLLSNLGLYGMKNGMPDLSSADLMKDPLQLMQERKLNYVLQNPRTVNSSDTPKNQKADRERFIQGYLREPSGKLIEDSAADNGFIEFLRKYLAEIDAAKKAAGDALGKNAGAGADGEPVAKREFELDKYIQKLRDEKEALRELVPLYAERARIQALGLKDMQPKGKQAAMSPGEASTKEQEAYKLYRETEGYRKINAAYGDMYTYAGDEQESAVPMSQKELKEILEAARADWQEKNKDLTERDNPYRFVDELSNLMADAGAAGSTSHNAFLATQKAARILHPEAKKPVTSDLSVGAKDYEDIKKIYQDLVGVRELSEEDLKFLARIGSMHDKSFGTDVLATINEYNNKVSESQRTIDKLTAAYERLKGTAQDSVLLKIRVAIQAEKEQQAGISDGVTALGQAGVNTQAFLTPELYREQRGTYEDNSTAGSRVKNAIGHAAYYAMGQGMTTDAANIFARPFIGNTKQAYADAMAAQEKWEAAKKDSAAADNGLAEAKKGGNADDIAKAQENADAAKKAVDAAAGSADKASNRFNKMASSLAVTAAAFKQIKDLALGTAFKALDTTMYDLGRSVSDGSDAWSNYRNSLKAMASEMLNQIPTILMQAAAGVLMTSGGAAWPLALGLLGAALGTSFLNGILGTKEDARESSDDAYSQMLENLQAQFQTLIDQFKATMSYLAIAQQEFVVGAQGASITGYAKGDVFSGSTGLQQGVYNQPTFFRFASGGAFSGVMGEAGPEAIMPLTRTASGALGVRTAGGASSSVNVIVNNNAPVSVEVEEEQTETGRNLTLTVEQLVASALAKGAGDGPLTQRYGMHKVGRG